MTVGELKKLLKDKPDDLEVWVWHCGTVTPLEDDKCDVRTSTWEKVKGGKYVCLYNCD